MSEFCLFEYCTHVSTNIKLDYLRKSSRQHKAPRLMSRNPRRRARERRMYPTIMRRFRYRPRRRRRPENPTPILRFRNPRVGKQAAMRGISASAKGDGVTAGAGVRIFRFVIVVTVFGHSVVSEGDRVKGIFGEEDRVVLLSAPINVVTTAAALVV